MNKRNKKIVYMTQLAILISIELIFTFVFGGAIPIGPIPATVAHLPVIIAALTMGVYGGAIMGFVFGLCSMIYFTLYPSPVAFVFTPFYGIGNFWSLIICFVPRILLGVICALVFKALKKVKMPEVLPYLISSIVATLCHTILVLAGIYIFFGKEYALVNNIDYQKLLVVFLGSIVALNGIIEIAIAAIVCPAVTLPLNKYILKKYY